MHREYRMPSANRIRCRTFGQELLFISKFAVKLVVMEASNHQPADPFVSVTPIAKSQAGRVMNLPSLLWHNFLFISLQTAWMWGLFLSLPLLRNGYPFGLNSIGYVGAICSLVWLVTQGIIVFVYPEWPMNRRLCQKLRQAIENRSDRQLPNTRRMDLYRVVELVPRDRWNKMALDTATDLMLIHITKRGLLMEGDKQRYWLPAESIVEAHLESVRPSGWFTPTHMVILIARGPEGTLEIPISIRDHSFGELRSRFREHAAATLVQQVVNIAKGVEAQNPLVVAANELPGPASGNPYAPPAIVQ